jgi:hypothetical protein
MATTVTAWVRINPALTNASALTQNDSVQNVVPLIIRLLPATPDQIAEDFQLPYNPLQVTYGDLSDEVTQIARPGTTPIIAFKSHRLMTVDFSFIVAQPGDGLATSVDSSLQNLRKFAASSNRVISLLNFDSLTNTPFVFRNSTQERLTDGLFFNIVSLEIQSVRRNKNNEITQANVNISLVENRNPLINVAFIPPLKYTKKPGKCSNKKYRRNNPGKCPKKTEKVTSPSQSELSRATAANNAYAQKDGFTRCFFNADGSMVCS